MNQNTKKTIDVRRLTTMGVLCAMAWAVAAIIRIPIVPAASFLKFDVKDVILGIGALIYGPVPGLLMSVVVSLIEMLTVSESGIIGFLMNVFASAAFICTASLIYKRHRNMKGAVVGLGLGVVLMTVVMLLWNFIITPFYMGVAREVVQAMLIPAILPFNLLKGCINAALILLLYKPVVSAMDKRNLTPSRNTQAESRSSKIGTIALAVFILVSCVLLIYSMAAA